MVETLSAYINARVRGMKSSLLPKTELSAMLDHGRLDGMAETLLKTPYEEEMAESLSRYQGAEAIEDAVSRNLVHTFAKLRRMCQEETRLLAEIVISRWDLGAVKSLLRNRHQGLDAATGERSLEPSPSMPQAVQQELASLDSMDGLVRGLAAWNSELCRGLLAALPAYQESGNLRVLEERLDRAYFVENVRRLEDMESDDARFVYDLLRWEIDRINLRRIFEPRPAGVGVEEVLREVLPKGTLGEQVLRDIASAGSPDRAAELVTRTAYGDMAEALESFAETGKFSRLERQFEFEYLERLKRAVQRQSLGLAILLRYAWLQYNEVTNLRLIAHGLAVNLPKQRIEQELVYV